MTNTPWRETPAISANFALHLALAVFLSACTPNQTTPPPLPDHYTYRATSLSELRTGFQEPPREAGPWVYWFWFENVVNREEISRELEEMAGAGIAGVELRCITMRGFKGNSPGPRYDPAGWEVLNHKKYQFLSPEFVDILEHTLSEAERLGLRFSMNLGMGWPPGGPWISDEHRSKHLLCRSRLVTGPVSLPRSSALNVGGCTRVSAWRIREKSVVDPASYVDLTSRISGGGDLEWEAPEGQWLLGMFTVVPGGLVDKGDGPEVDPASAEALRFHLKYIFDRLDPNLSRFYGSTLESLATDSWEFARSPENGRYWSSALLESAPAVLGYDFENHMYSLLGYGPEKEERLRDLRRLEETLIHENFFGLVTRFLNDRRLRHRPQAYGRGLERNLFEAYARVDIPEVEEGVYVPEAVWTARLLGKPIISEEAFTHLSIRHPNLRMDGLRGAFFMEMNPDNMWQTTPPLLRRFANAHFARGANRIQYHSFSYSPPGIPAPGWRMYAEIFLNRNVSWWNEWPELNQWMARNQFVLQSGFPVTEFLVYPQVPNPVDGPFNVPDNQPWTAMNAVDAADAGILRRLIENGSELSGRIRHIIVREDPASLEEATNLLRLAEMEIPLTCLQHMPEDWKILRGPDAQGLVERFSTVAGRDLIRDSRGQDWKAVADAWQSVRWTPSDAKLSFQRRRVSGGEIYFISSWENSFEGELTFIDETGTPEIWNANSGQIETTSVQTTSNGQTVIRLNLNRNASRIVIFRK